jgi:hypothetical protein
MALIVTGSINVVATYEELLRPQIVNAGKELGIVKITYVKKKHSQNWAKGQKMRYRFSF